jgi:hypothetical protein
MPDVNARDYYIAARTRLAKVRAATPRYDAVDYQTDTTAETGLTPLRKKKRYPTAGKIAWVRKCAPVLQNLRRGLVYPYVEPLQARSIGYHAPIPYQAFRDFGDLLCIESHSRSEQDDWLGAARVAVDALRLGYSVMNGGDLTNVRYGLAPISLVVTELQGIWPHLDARSARETAAAIEKLESSRPSLAVILREEKSTGQLRLQQSMRLPGWRTGLLPNDYAVTALPSLLLCSKQRLMRNYTQYMDAAIYQAGLPYATRKAPSLPGDPYTRGMLDDFELVQWQIARNETRSRLLILQLAIHAFRLERKRLPVKLEELAPTYISTVPLDPCSGIDKPLYRRSGETYVLYSIGPDGKDDGGKPIERPGATEARTRYLAASESTGDFMAGLNR